MCSHIFIKETGNIAELEMMRTFNNGIGMVIVVNEEEINEVLSRLNAMNETAFHIGSIESRGDDEGAVQFAD